MLLLPLTKAIDWMALTGAIKAQVPTLAGLSTVRGQLAVTRADRRDFDSAETALILAIVAAHDVAAMEAAKSAKLAKIKADASSVPGNLNDKDRLARLERLIDYLIERVGVDRKSTRLNSSHLKLSRMPSSA